MYTGEIQYRKLSEVTEMTACFSNMYMSSSNCGYAAGTFACAEEIMDTALQAVSICVFRLDVLRIIPD